MTMVTDELIREKLPRSEARELLHLSREIKMPPVYSFAHGIKTEKDLHEFFKTQREQLCNLIEWRASKIALDRSKKIIRCWDLYNQTGLDLMDCMKHWLNSAKNQDEIRSSYKKMERPARQDNKTYLNTSPSGYGSNRNKIRYPKKKRKTAWKRFYKLFPHLKPEENEKTPS